MSFFSGGIMLCFIMLRIVGWQVMLVVLISRCVRGAIALLYSLLRNGQFALRFVYFLGDVFLQYVWPDCRDLCFLLRIYIFCSTDWSSFLHVHFAPVPLFLRIQVFPTGIFLVSLFFLVSWFVLRLIRRGFSFCEAMYCIGPFSPLVVLFVRCIRDLLFRTYFVF